MQWTVAIVVGMLAFQALPGAAAERPAAGARNYHGPGRAWTQRALDEAISLLQKPECQLVFGDFSDADGVLLGTKLRDLGLKAEEYLIKGMWFVDGNRDRQCQISNVAAYTQRNSRVVSVCPARLSNERANGALVIIHEMLHSLGLGENPPTPQQITKKVLDRCL